LRARVVRGFEVDWARLLSPPSFVLLAFVLRVAGFPAVDFFCVFLVVFFFAFFATAASDRCRAFPVTSSVCGKERIPHGRA
jgi:hypothetical protein